MIKSNSDQWPNCCQIGVSLLSMHIREVKVKWLAVCLRHSPKRLLAWCLFICSWSWIGLIPTWTHPTPTWFRAGPNLTLIIPPSTVEFNHTKKKKKTAFYKPFKKLLGSFNRNDKGCTVIQIHIQSSPSPWLLWAFWDSLCVRGPLFKNKKISMFAFWKYAPACLGSSLMHDIRMGWGMTGVWCGLGVGKISLLLDHSNLWF